MSDHQVATEPERFVLTGPSGWIGTAFLHWFRSEYGSSWVSRVSLYGSSERLLLAPDGQHVPVRPLASLSPADVAGAWVIHLAYLTKERVLSVGEPEFFSANRLIDDYVLNALEDGKARGVFVSSSGAAKSATTGKARELYGVCKLLQEDRFLAFARMNEVALWVGRIYNLAGPGINKIDSYALSSFLSQAATTGTIQITANMPVYRSYLHVLDLCELVVRSLRVGFAAPAAVDLCGALVVEMEDVAKEVARIAGLSGNWMQRGQVDFTKIGVYVGDSIATLALALRLGMTLRPFSEQVADTALDLARRGVTGLRIQVNGP